MQNSAESIRPVSLRITPRKSLEIEWSDGQRLECSLKSLREACPCATCKEKKRAQESKPVNKLMILSEAETVPLAILDMRPVGNYAYNIAFSDGHTSGLFTIEHLRELGVPSAETEPGLRS